MGTDKYDRPSKGTPNWDEPVNRNFRDLGVEVVAEVETFDDLPDPDPEEASTSGERRKVLVRESRVVYRDDGDGWAAVAGLGAPDARVPGTVYHETHDAEAQVIDGRRLYVQDDEPADPDEQDVWIDTS
jgi:hypothetical protein